jgi:hypothetical protein
MALFFMEQNLPLQRTLDRLSDYSDESLLRELRRVSGALGRTSLTMGDIESHGRCSYALLKRRFGGLRAALDKAGLGGRGAFHRNVSDEQLMAELARIWDLVLTHEGRRPYKKDLAKYGARFSEGPYFRRWGSWVGACEALLRMGTEERRSGFRNACLRQTAFKYKLWSQTTDSIED